MKKEKGVGETLNDRYVFDPIDNLGLSISDLKKDSYLFDCFLKEASVELSRNNAFLLDVLDDFAGRLSAHAFCLDEFYLKTIDAMK